MQEREKKPRLTIQYTTGAHKFFNIIHPMYHSATESIPEDLEIKRTAHPLRNTRKDMFPIKASCFIFVKVAKC